MDNRKLKDKLGLCSKSKCYRKSKDTINVDANNVKIQKHLCKKHSLEFTNKLVREKNNENITNKLSSISSLFSDVLIILFNEDLFPYICIILIIIFNIFYWIFS